MKYFLFFNIIFISSCSLFSDYSWIGINSLKTIEQITFYIQENIEYKKDLVDYWQLPEETYNLKQGDCEDIASLMAHLLIYNANINNVLLIGCIQKIDNQPHMMIKINNIYYEPITDLECDYHTIYYTLTELSYKNYIDIARFYHL